MGDLSAPFPWFGGKSRVADLVWSRFGNVYNYVEPFAGSLAVLLGRPAAMLPAKLETVNDLDGFISNVWRAIAADPAGVAKWADWPVNENDLHARHAWLTVQRADLSARLQGDPDFFDARIAGWWLWGIGCWIGRDWCSGRGPWRSVGGRLVKSPGADGGVMLTRPSLGQGGRGVNGNSRDTYKRMADLSARLRRVRVCSGDWSRVCGPAPTYSNGLTGVFLDPPYAAAAGRVSDLYSLDSLTVADDVRAWAVANGDNPLLRIALCGYDGEHVLPDSWACVPWIAQGGMGNKNANGYTNGARERVWFSPHCLRPASGGAVGLFDGGEVAS